MKRILTTLAMLTAFAFGASAQRSIDMEVTLISPTADTPVTTVLGCGTTDTLRMNILAINRGPDQILTGDTVWYGSPRSDIGYISGFLADTTYGVGDTVVAGNLNIAYSQIMKLWGSDGSGGLVEIAKADLNTNNATYAAIFSIERIGGVTSAVNDDNTDNNYGVGLVRLNCATGLTDLFGTKKEALNAYPNPTTGKLTFKYNFENTTASVRITDIAGRVVMSQEYGKQSGVKEITMDVSALNNGMYFMELVAGEKHAISKVSVQK